MSQFRNLVFEGGGVKGIAYAGALQVLEQKNVLPDIRRVAGTSAGAITAVLVALGASSKTVFEIIGGTNFRSFMDDSFGVIRDFERLKTDFGWYRGDAFSAWMQKQISVLSGNPTLTFRQHAARVAKEPQRLRDLYMIGSNLTLQMPVVYSAETTPDMQIWEATRISMSIPLFFACMRSAPGNQVLVDGGVTWNYPLDLFDDVKYLSTREASAPIIGTKYDDNHVCNFETLGLRVDTADEIAAEKNSWNLPPRKVDDFFDYLQALVGFMNDMANKMHLRPRDWCRTVVLDAAGIATTDFSLSDEKVALLMKNGIDGTEAYFKWFEDPNAAPAPLNRLPAPVGGG